MSRCQICGFPTTTGGCTNETCPTREPWRSPMAMVVGDAEARLEAVKASYEAENATLRAENARLREALETVRVEERARCVGIVEARQRWDMDDTEGPLTIAHDPEGEYLYRSDVIRALTGGPHE